MSYEAAHRRDWERAADRAAEVEQRYMDRVFIEYLALVTYEREGIVTALDTSARRVRVSLLGAVDPAGQDVQASYGQPTFRRADVGKKVRVWERVKRRLEPTGPVIVERAYIIDTVLGGQ